jgi:hypothetical protein
MYETTNKTISKLNNFIILQYIEVSVESHLIVVPKKPNIPEPNIPPFELEIERFPIYII